MPAEMILAELILYQQNLFKVMDKHDRFLTENYKRMSRTGVWPTLRTQSLIITHLKKGNLAPC